MDKFKEIWNNPRYNALIRLGLWFIFFTLVIIFIRLSPKEEVPRVEEEVQVTYSDIKKEFVNSSVMLTMDNGTYYVNGVIKMVRLQELFKVMVIQIRFIIME